MTRLLRCLRLTLLKWSTMESSTKGWTLVWVIGALLIFKKYLNRIPNIHIAEYSQNQLKMLTFALRNKRPCILYPG